jgi:hypothetical protein
MDGLYCTLLLLLGALTGALIALCAALDAGTPPSSLHVASGDAAAAGAR